jgi:hypothetical protein
MMQKEGRSQLSIIIFLDRLTSRCCEWEQPEMWDIISTYRPDSQPAYYVRASKTYTSLKTNFIETEKHEPFIYCLLYHYVEEEPLWTKCLGSRRDYLRFNCHCAFRHAKRSFNPIRMEAKMEIEY